MADSSPHCDKCVPEPEPVTVELRLKLVYQVDLNDYDTPYWEKMKKLEEEYNNDKEGIINTLEEEDVAVTEVVALVHPDMTKEQFLAQKKVKYI